jgi:hypothetical protein
MEAVADKSTSQQVLPPKEQKSQRTSSAGRWVSVLFFAILGVVTSFFAYEYFLNHIDREIRVQVLKRLRAEFPESVITVGRAHLDPGRGVAIEDLSISIPYKSGTKRAIFVRRLYAVGLIDIPDLIAKKISISKLELDGLELTLWKENNNWAIGSLIPKKFGSVEPCDIVFRDGEIRLLKSLDSTDEMIFHDMSVVLSPVLEQSPATGVAPKTVYQIHHGRVASSYFTSLGFDGKLDITTGEWECRGIVRQLQFGPGFRERLPPDAAVHLSRLTGLECVADAEFKIGQKDKSSEPLFEIDGSVDDGRLKDSGLPYLLEELRGRFFVDNRMIKLREIRASSGQSTFELEAILLGSEPQSPLRFRVLAKNLDLDNRLYQALPVWLQRQWDRFMLEGRVDADLDLQFDGVQWSPIAVVDCRSVSLRYAHFPYPITNLNGRFEFRDKQLKSTTPITARASGQMIGGAVALEIDSGTWQGWIDIASDAMIPIDDTLIESLTPLGCATTSGHNFAKSLEPSGMLQIKRLRLEKPSFDSQTLNRDFALNFQNGSIKFKDFPYPIHHISGALIAKNEQWSLVNFSGQNDNSRIRCGGSWLTGDFGIQNLVLEFDATNVALDEQLRQALPTNVANLWSQLQPKGRVDTVNIVYGKVDSNTAADLVVNISQPPSIPGASESTLAIQPLALPYLLQEVACELLYQKGVVDLKSFSARHGVSHLQTEGTVQQTQEGWIALLKWLPTTRVTVDGDFVTALPKRLRDTLRQIDFKGPVGVLGWSRIGPIADTNLGQEVPATWDLELDLEDTKLKDGSWLQGIRGTIRTAGYSTANGPMADGFMLIDSLALRGVPMANVQGPFAIRESKVYFGEKVVEVESLKSSASVSASPIRADLFSGQAIASGTGQLDPLRFSVESKLVGGRLQEILMETGQASANASGVCDAVLTLQGSPLNPQTLNGVGEVTIREASLFQLPSMMKLLRMLSVKPPNDAAFEKADISFRIDGDRLPIDHLAIDGDVISLAGSGWANLRRELHLDLYAYVGNRNQLAKLVGPLLSETRYAPLMQVEITGSLEAPEMTRKPLPVIEDALKTYFPERYANEKNGVLKF